LSRIFITGSADGLGKMAAQLLVSGGHQVVLHARNPQRAADAMASVPGAEAVVTGDLSGIAGTVGVAENVQKLGFFDAIIHNAGVGYRESVRGNTTEGLPTVFAVNSLAPFILTCLITRPHRLIYISSGLHRSGDPSLTDLIWKERRWNGFSAYADSKLHNVLLAFAVARKWRDILSNAMEPGWVATKMGGPGAPDSLMEAPKTQAWLATSSDPDALVSGKYFFHQQAAEYLPASNNAQIQDRLLWEYERISGISFPSNE
jgi:NAD(P)-dependent dehydrogenase (short-subunit alcohol dehydrogenase family)